MKISGKPGVDDGQLASPLVQAPEGEENLRFPLSLSLDLGRYLLKKRLPGEEKFPLVLMLEPTHQCNLSCQGCGRIQEYRDTLGQSLTLEECLDSVEECGAPVVTITGGEPLIYPPVFELLQELVHRRKHIYLCSNAILLEKSLPQLPVPTASP